ncbi:MAG: cellulase family glycosylhydrolase [Chitinophagaceae bacterium]
MRIFYSFIFFLAVFTANGQALLRAKGSSIRDGHDQEIILRGMGLGGWMLQEPYMLKLSGAAMAQHEIRKKVEDLVGKKNTVKFYDTWLANHCTKGDIDSLAAWGFNSVRLPMHYNLFTLPVEKEPVKGKNSWLEKGFALTDSLLGWCKANHIYLILDLHATPGGQGNDNAISDRDPSKPSLWQEEANRQKTIALWEKLASRYATEEWIGGYDLVNEPNWGFDDASDKNGCSEKNNTALKNLLKDITTAIRKNDRQHILFIEGNCWANNYDGMFPLWDDNIVVSFHKYWNYTDKTSIQRFLDIRTKYNVPVWAGETGENSNSWFTDVITLLEANKIGWNMWPLKKSGLNNPLQVKIDPRAEQVFDYWKGIGAKPPASSAREGLLQLARNTHIKNNIVHRDVIDAMIRQVNTAEVTPFHQNIIVPGTLLYATDYDMGRSGITYHDEDSAEYWVSTTKRTPWNSGGYYRNDGVDIEPCTDAVTNGYNVGWIQAGEWLQYSIYLPEDGQFDLHIRSASKDNSGEVRILLNDVFVTGKVLLPRTGETQKWETSILKNIKLPKGLSRLRVLATSGGFNLNYLEFTQTDNTTRTD